MSAAPWFLTAMGAYLLGSIPVGYLMMKWGRGIDIRTIGSGNIGMTNVWRAAGWKWGLPVLLLDIAKGFTAVFAPPSLLGDDPFALLRVLGGVCVMLGNVFPLFLGFKGGKGVGTAIGVFLTLLPLPTGLAFGVFLLTVLPTRMISAGSLMAALALAVSTLLLRRPHDLVTAFSVLAAALVWWTHRSNIRRILAGTENRIGSGRGKTRPGRRP
jgi:glycerol-3-phosphate acyltransferase PlsY